MTEIDIINAIKLVAKTYGNKMAINIEKLFRNETRHFKSGGFANTLSPGMEAVNEKYPYGWTSLKSFWDKNHKPIGLNKQTENSSAMLSSRGVRTFIVFKSIEDSMMSVAELINIRGGDPGTWFSNSNTPQGVAARKKYNDELSKIIARYCKANNIN